MANKIPADRIQLAELAPRGYAAMFRLSGTIQLDEEIRELIDIRASQINGCAFCLDMHWKDARASGETEERLYMLSTWRESSLYSERERAALELCEAMTLIAEAQVPDDVWQRAVGVQRVRAQPAGVRDHHDQCVEPAQHRDAPAAGTLRARHVRPKAAHGWPTALGRGRRSGRHRGPPAAEEQLATEFARLRPYLLRVAYSHLGSLSEAEDLVQEAWIRLERTDRAEIRNLRAWLTTVVSRLALDALTSARSRRESYVGPWLPEPLVQADPSAVDPAHQLDLDESVSMALLVVLESLSPAERSAFLLHDVFGYSFNEVAEIVDVLRRRPASSPHAADTQCKLADRDTRPSPRSSARSSRPSKPPRRTAMSAR